MPPQTWAQLHPYPAADSPTRYRVTARLMGCRVETVVCGMDRVIFTMALWSSLQYDDIKFKRLGKPPKQVRQNAPDVGSVFNSHNTMQIREREYVSEK